MMVTKNTVEEKLIQQVEQVIKPMGFYIVDLDCRIGGKSLVRVFIDHVDKTLPSISLDECKLVSQTIDPLIEGVDEIPGAFDLEVSSPGLDRRLRVMSDFEAVVGKKIHAIFTNKIDKLGGKSTGLLKGIETESILLEVNKETFRVPVSSMSQASLIWEQ